MSTKFKQLRFEKTTAALRGSESVIGRSVYCSVVLADPSVSRAHASLFEEDGATYVRDLGSKNGTTVNEQPVDGKPRRLDVGDVLTFGNARCVLEACDGASCKSATTERPASDDATLETTQRMVLSPGKIGGRKR